MVNLQKKSLVGLFWMTFGKVGSGLTSLLVTIILSRLLVPEDFALIELLIIFIAVSNVFIDSGFSQAIIRDINPSHKDLSSVFYLNLLIGLVLYTVLFFIAPIIADFFDSPKLILLSRVIFIVLILNSLFVVQNANLARELKFKIISKCSLLSMLGAAIISVILAFNGGGLWAIVSNIILQPLFKCILMWYFSTWRPSFEFNICSIRKYFSFSSFLLLQGIMDAVTTNINSLLIGKIYTKTDLGYYSQGRKLDMYIIFPFITIVEQVLYPVMSKVKEDKEKLQQSYIFIFKLLILFFFPISIFVIFNSSIIVEVLFGKRWLNSAVFLTISSSFYMFYPMQRISESIIKLEGKTKTLFYIDLGRQLLRLLTVLLVARINIIVLACGFTVAGIIGGIFYIVYAFRIINYSIVKFMICQSLTISLSIISLILTSMLSNLFECIVLYKLIANILIYISIYLSLSVMLNRKIVLQIRKVFF